MAAAIDLYSGIGGWTLGFKMAGIKVIASYEWWKDANDTHNKNFGSEHKETNIRALELADLPNKRSVKFVVGSPPCTQFSLANRGGKGDIADGLVDIKKFLEVVEHMEPKYWAMENVPRVAKILEKELAPEGALARFEYLFRDIRVYNSSDFGVPQDRKRMIAGNFPFDLLDGYAAATQRLNLSDVLRALEQAPYIDPIYGINLDGPPSDHVLEPNLSLEEARINQESKLHHPVYNKMSFPDRQDRPSRTITALCTRVSRESIIIRDAQDNLRRLTVRERGLVQSFPINYQFFGKTYPNKLKMIGNAVPPLLTFYIAQSMQEIPVERVMGPRDVPAERLVLSPQRATDSIPDNEGARYSWSRTFWLAIKGLRFGSGVRFELRNHNDKETETTTWRVHFFYGNSKQIEKIDLDLELLKRAFQATELNGDETFMSLFESFQGFVGKVDEKGLQLNWTNIDRKQTGPIDLIDGLASYATTFKDHFKQLGAHYSSSIRTFISEEFGIEEEEGKRNKLQDNATDIFIGILIGANFNRMMNKETLKLKKPRVRA
jgi:DNA (cytosine-5)-methyltransferase 1